MKQTGFYIGFNELGGGAFETPRGFGVFLLGAMSPEEAAEWIGGNVSTHYVEMYATEAEAVAAIDALRKEAENAVT